MSREIINTPNAPSSSVVIDLDFDAEQDAAEFLEVLRTRIWSTPSNSPALADTPIGRLFYTEEADTPR